MPYAYKKTEPGSPILQMRFVSSQQEASASEVYIESVPAGGTKGRPYFVLDGDGVSLVAEQDYTPPTTGNRINLISESSDDLKKLIFKVLFNHENRIRALEGAGQITRDQFKSALEGLL